MNVEWNAQEEIDRLKRTIAAETAAAKHFKVLVVEDNINDAEFLIGLLGKWPCKVSWVRSGQDAVDSIVANGFKVMFLDLKLPGMDGVQVLGQIKAAGKDVSVVIVTGYAKDAAIYEASRKSGALIVIPKPVSESDLVFVLGVFDQQGGKSA